MVDQLPGDLLAAQVPQEQMCGPAVAAGAGLDSRAMPADFLPWDRVCAFFRRWRDRALVRGFHDRLRGRGG
ncbi:hypothetical protein [Streptomyces pratensis]|uniref:hypothetical protein n=1 Tax=Streptomyces pratensis TaxID=1169025 RepID=UPI003018D180